MDLLKHLETTTDKPLHKTYMVIGTPVARGIAVRRVSRFFSAVHSYNLAQGDWPEVEDEMRSSSGLMLPRLFIVRNAHLWPDAKFLKEWTARKEPDVLVMESGITQWRPPGWASRNGEFKPDLKRVFSGTTKATVVTTEFANSKVGRLKLQQLVSMLTGCGGWEAKLVAESGHWHTEQTLITALRLRPLGNMTPQAIHVMREPVEDDTFTDALLKGHKADALRILFSAEHIPDRVLHDLSFAVDTISMMGRNRRMGDSPFALATRLNIHRALVEKYLTYTKFSDPGTTARRVDALASVAELWSKATTLAQKREALLLLTTVW